MSETSIKPINSIRMAESGTPIRTQTSTATDGLSVPKADVAADQNRSSKQVEEKPQQVSNSSNIAVHFQINDENNELTVFIVDRNSKRVLRSIPASEFYKLQSGDLLKLTA